MQQNGKSKRLEYPNEVHGNWGKSGWELVNNGKPCCITIVLQKYKGISDAELGYILENTLKGRFYYEWLMTYDVRFYFEYRQDWEKSIDMMMRILPEHWQLNQYPNPTWEVAGFTKSFDLNKGHISVHLNNFPEPQSVPITDHMPQWLFEKNPFFRVKIPYHNAVERDLTDVVWGVFHRQEGADLTVEELVKDLAVIFNSEGKDESEN